MFQRACRLQLAPYVLRVVTSTTPGVSPMSNTHSVTPHLVVKDANAAIDFYKKALGATETMRMPAQDGKRLMHAEIQLNGARILLMDDFPEHRAPGGHVDAVFPPDQMKGTSVT